MRYDLGDVRTALADTVARFLEDACPVESRRSWFGALEGERFDALWRSCADLGIAGLFVPTGSESGSVSGQPLVDAAIIAEIAGRTLTPMPFAGVSATVAALAGAPLELHALRDRLAAGEMIASLAIEEAGGRWAPSDIATIARIDGDEIEIDGEKVLVADIRSAGLFCVVCRLEGAATVVLVPADAAGVALQPVASLDLLRDYGTLTLKSVRVPRRSALSPEVCDADRLVEVAQCLNLADSVGALDALFDLTVDYARQRHAFGRPIGSFQALKHRIATLMLWVESCKAIVDSATDAVDSGASDAAELVAIARAYVGDRSVLIAQECTQIFGGIGLTFEHDAHLFLRRLTVNRARLGTPEQHRLAVAGHLPLTIAAEAC